MSRNTDYHSGAAVGAQAWTAVQVRLSPDDRKLLVRLTHDKAMTASEVIRLLIREAAT